MDKRDFLFDNMEQFFNSPVWIGERFYNAKPYRPWFGWIYLALYDHIPVEDYKKDDKPGVQIKIGQSSDIDRRNKELFRDQTSKGKVQKKSSIVYAWSVPLCIRFESDLKTLLAAYIRVDPKRAQASEIIWGIPLAPLINIVQLSILKTCLHMRFIRSDMQLTLKPPDTIIFQDKTYPGKKKYMVPHEFDIDDMFAHLSIKTTGDTTSIEDYVFLQDKRIPAETSPTHNIPEFEGEILPHSELLTEKVYPVGTYAYAEYKDNLLYLCKIIGYGKTKDQKYAIRWLVTTLGDPVRTGDSLEPLELSTYKWEWTKTVNTIHAQNRAVFEKFKEVDGVKAGDKVIVKKLRLD